MPDNKTFLEVVNDDEFKNTLVKAINESVNIPIIGEDIEGLLFKTLVETMIIAYAKCGDD